MLSNCMLTPLKLARLVEWKGRIGKSSALLSIDVSNQQIGLALAYYRQLAPTGDNSGVIDSATTLLTPLPPLPYMSTKTCHPSYAFLRRPQLDATTSNSLRREERTLEIANQLAQLAKQREVNGILVRWPGDLGGVVCGSAFNEGGGVAKNREEADHLLISLKDDETSSRDPPLEHGDGSMGYLRGRILYLLDKCCSGHGHDETIALTESLLVEGVRPFTLWDTSNSEQNWVLHQQHHNNAHSDVVSISSSVNRVDKYGNSFSEMDSWGRSAIFGNKPPLQHQREGRFRYSSKQPIYGYRVSSEFSSSQFSSGNFSRPHRDDFDTFQDRETYLKQFEGSLAAMHALYEFVSVYLQGTITLPSWVSTSPKTKHLDRQATAVMGGDEERRFAGNLRNSMNNSKHTEISSATGFPSRQPIKKQEIIAHKKANSSAPRKSPIVALAQMPVWRRRRGAGDRG